MSISRSYLRKSILATAVLVSFLMVIRNGFPFLPVFDFCEYWAAGKLASAGINPYSVYDIARIEQQLDSSLQSAVMMLNPPWTLPIVIPFSFLSFDVAQIVWRGISILILVWCFHRIWRQNGSIGKPYFGLLFGLLFAPTLMSLKLGQITPLILLGLVLFIDFQDERPFAAGAAFALTMIKPHLLYLVLIAFFIDSIRNRRWRLLGGFFTCLAGFSLAAIAIHPAIFADYLSLIGSHYGDFVSSAGGLLRVIFGPEHRWLQFAPMLFGLAWYSLRAARRPLLESLPALAFASIITTSYGWTHDQTVLLFALIPALTLSIARKTYLPLVVFLVSDVLLVSMYELHVSEQFLIWTTPCWALVYWSARNVRERDLEESVV